MKKLIFSLLVIVLLIAIYLYKKNDKEPRYIELQSENATVTKQKRPASKTAVLQERVVKTADKNFEEYDHIEKNWLDKAENILGKKDFDFYQDLRLRNDEEKMHAYKEFHDYLRAKNGDNFSYHISEDQSIREKNINSKYTQEFIKRVGNEKFKSYLKARDEFNEILRRKSPTGHTLVIEF